MYDNFDLDIAKNNEKIFFIQKKNTSNKL